MVLPNYGLACWNRETATMRNYKICPPGSCGAYFSASWVSTMVKDREDGSYWIGSNDGLLQFWPASGALQVYRPRLSWPATAPS